MKKVLSFLLVFVLLFSISCVMFGAAETAKTTVTVNEGDTVKYTLSASDVPDSVVCADFSIYYDSDVLTCNNFSDTPDGSVVNKDLDGEVRGNFIDLNGVDYTSTNGIITVEFTAKKTGASFINYYMRDFCTDKDNEIVEIEEYSFTCSVDVNSTKVIDNKPAELNVEEKQDVGGFMNSISGSSKDAGINVYQGVSNVDDVVFDNGSGSNGGEINENDPKATTKTNDSSNLNNNSSTEKIVASDAAKSVDGTLSTASNAEASTKSNGPSVWLWIVIGLIVIGAAIIVIYFIKKNKQPIDTIE